MNPCVDQVRNVTKGIRSGDIRLSSWTKHRKSLTVGDIESDITTEHMYDPLGQERAQGREPRCYCVRASYWSPS